MTRSTPQTLSYYPKHAVSGEMKTVDLSDFQVNACGKDDGSKKGREGGTGRGRRDMMRCKVSPRSDKS